MEQLITIETVPIKIEYVKKESLDLSAVHNQNAKKDVAEGGNQQQSKPIRIALNDSFEPSTDYQWDNSTYTATAKVGNNGKLELEVSMEDGQAQPIHFKHLSRGINEMASLMTSTGNQASAVSSSMVIPFDTGSLGSGSQTANDANFQLIMPDIELKITQRPQVIIKYVGGPIYVPRSADPNYEPVFGFEPEAGNGVKLDQKA
ncbi:MAG: hypothetical protein CVU92_01230 [Firmicutes bacterium HGW-Firmicutes-17]|nr:MAG: hypothetical protein CVU92_01230 [Firmicutes bacterium HGW-Firmicutes-17]